METERDIIFNQATLNDYGIDATDANCLHTAKISAPFDQLIAAALKIKPQWFDENGHIYEGMVSGEAAIELIGAELAFRPAQETLPGLEMGILRLSSAKVSNFRIKIHKTDDHAKVISFTVTINENDDGAGLGEFYRGVRRKQVTVTIVPKVEAPKGKDGGDDSQMTLSDGAASDEKPAYTCKHCDDGLDFHPDGNTHHITKSGRKVKCLHVHASKDAERALAAKADMDRLQ